MSKDLATNLVSAGISVATKSATKVLLNSNCIVCGKAFEVPRMSKLYCSARCKQTGFNHRYRVSEVLASQNQGLGALPQTFYLEDYTAYSDTQRQLKRYRELNKKKQTWESTNQEIVLKQHYGLDTSPYLWESLTSRKLTESEELELDDAESALDEGILLLNLRELSLEQWSFLKSLYSGLDELSFWGVVSALSPEFILQLTLKNATGVSPEWLVIKNRFINHCNLIATGVIRFEKREG